MAARSGGQARQRRERSVPPPSIPGAAMTAAHEGGSRLVVGIGASAGGLDAFKAFFSAVPADSGMSFVLVQHLDPRHESSLATIVGGYTAMPVRLAEDGAALGSNQVHVIAPDTILTVEDGHLRVSRPAPPAARRTAINIFLSSLAQDQGENAVGIILSGFGSDGALGVAAIKEFGGLTLSQAEFDHQAKGGMPQSAASGGFVDHVLTPEDMPAALLDYQRHRVVSDGAKGADGVRLDLPSHLATICAVLHGRLGRDFSQYKPGTLMRRIQRRMHVLGTDEVPAYVEQLRKLPNEAELLFRELLISVTRFFRDPGAFAALEAQVLPGLLAEARGSDPFRIWVAGCATGEEAYSMAILLREGLAQSGVHRPVQVFATDVDDRAIDAARAGLYPGTIAADLSAERLKRHFVKEDGSFRVAKALREMCLFSVHDLVRDPPFSRLDLISCRNLMIYFKPRLQQRVLSTFHYALRPGGCLFLGPSEGVANQAQLFAPLDKQCRIFTRRDTAASLPAVSPSRVRKRAARAASPAAGDIDRWAARAIARYAPAFLVVDREHDVLRFSGQTAKYLEPAPGIASLNLFALLHADLRPAVRAALRQAAATGARVLHDGLGMEVGDHHEAVNLIVEPLPGPEGDGPFLVAFQDADPPGTAAPGGSGLAGDAAQALNDDLLATRERLRNLTEEMDAANEELRSSNEEYLSVNEELQSANEELETSKEELQSLNEELHTINTELNARNESLVRSNSDLANLFDSTSIATLFLDGDLRIRRFTPRLLDIFKVREGDEGRPITDIVTRLTRDGLGQDLRQVLGTLVPIEREVAVAEDGMSYLMRVRPYRDLNNVVNGAVVTFVDISERKQHEQARARLAAIVASSQDAIIGQDLDGVITSWNAGAEQLYGYGAAEAIGRPLSTLLADGVADDWPQVLARLQRGERIAQFDSARVAKNGRTIDVSVTISPVKEADGRVVGASVVARDVGERRRAERKASLLLGELDHRVKNILAVVSAVVSQTAKNGSTPEAFAAEVQGRIQAIAQAHGLLTQAGQGEIALRDLVATELAPYNLRGAGNISMVGDDVALTPRAGMALALAVHELASNAAKYGALSTPSGRLAVSWTTTGGAGSRTLAFMWAETGGPAVRPPSRRGFGTTLIERALSSDLDAEVSREFLVSGLRCAIRIPLTEEAGSLRAAGEGKENVR